MCPLFQVEYFAIVNGQCNPANRNAPLAELGDFLIFVLIALWEKRNQVRWDGFFLLRDTDTCNHGSKGTSRVRGCNYSEGDAGRRSIKLLVAVQLNFIIRSDE